MTEDKMIDGVSTLLVEHDEDGHVLYLMRDDGFGVDIPLHSDTFEKMREIFMLKSKRN